jgi:hypothetical protein
MKKKWQKEATKSSSSAASNEPSLKANKGRNEKLI